MGEFSDQDHDAILAIHDRWIAEEIAGNGLAVLQYCTDDVRWLVPGGLLVTVLEYGLGRQAARQGEDERMWPSRLLNGNSFSL